MTCAIGCPAATVAPSSRNDLLLRCCRTPNRAGDGCGGKECLRARRRAVITQHGRQPGCHRRAQGMPCGIPECRNLAPRGGTGRSAGFRQRGIRPATQPACRRQVRIACMPAEKPGRAYESRVSPEQAPCAWRALDIRRAGVRAGLAAFHDHVLDYIFLGGLFHVPHGAVEQGFDVPRIL